MLLPVLSSSILYLHAGQQKQSTKSKLHSGVRKSYRAASFSRTASQPALHHQSNSLKTGDAKKRGCGIRPGGLVETKVGFFFFFFYSLKECCKETFRILKEEETGMQTIGVSLNVTQRLQ